MEPPESPSKPRRTKPESEADVDKPKRTTTKKTAAADEVKAEAKPAPKPRTTSKTSEAASPDRPAMPKSTPQPAQPKPSEEPPIPAVPVMNTTAPVVEPVVLPPMGKTSATMPPKPNDMAASRPVTPPARPPAATTGATSSQMSGKQIVSVLRTGMVRNLELLRNSPRNMGNTRVGNKTLGNYWQDVKTASTKFWVSVDRQLMKLQTELEQSDTAVIVYTLVAILACVVLTLVAQRLWATH